MQNDENTTIQMLKTQSYKWWKHNNTNTENTTIQNNENTIIQNDENKIVQNDRKK